MTGHRPSAGAVRTPFAAVNAAWVARTALLCAVVALTLGLAVAGRPTPAIVDRAFADGAERLLGGTPLPHLLVVPTEPWAVLAILAIAVLMTGRHRDNAARIVFTVAAPALAVGLNTAVLKPLFDRHYDDHLAYPSGHTVSFVATVTVVVLLLPTPRARLLAVALGSALTVGAAAGMACLGYHYATDVVGGAATAVAVSLATALVVQSPLTRGRSATWRHRGTAR